MDQNLIDYFFRPIETGYTWEKTLIYAIIAIVAIFLIFKLLKKLKIKINGDFFLAISPYILLGSSLRAMKDLGKLESYVFVTPGIYFLIFVVTIATLLIFKLFEKRFRIPYYKPTFLLGLFLSSIVIAHLPFFNSYGLFLVLIFYLPWPLFFLSIKWNLPNKIVSSVQMFDATVTFIAVNFFGYSEQHVLPTLLINLFGPLSFLISKVVAVIIALLLIDKLLEEEEMRNYIKLWIGILAGATGLRDFLCLLSLCRPS